MPFIVKIVRQIGNFTIRTSTLTALTLFLWSSFVHYSLADNASPPVATPSLTLESPVKIGYTESTAGRFVGACMIQDIYEQAGIPVELVARPNLRSIMETINGHNDGQLQRIFKFGLNYTNLVRIPTSFKHADIVVFRRNNDQTPTTKSYGDLKHFSVAYVEGMRFAEIGLKGFPDVKVVPDEVSLFRVLSAGRVDRVITTHFDGKYIIASEGIENVVAEPVILERLILYHYLHPSKQALVPLLDLQIREKLSKGTLENLLSHCEANVMTALAEKTKNHSISRN